MRFIAVVSVLIALFGCAAPGIVEAPFSTENILPLNEYRELKEIGDIHRYAAFIEKGDTIPLKLTVESDFIGVAQKQVDLVAKERLLFRIRMSEALSQETLDRLLSIDQERLAAMTPTEKEAFFKDVMLLISRDGTRWAPLNDMKAVKHVLGIESGEFGLGMSLSQTDGIWAFLSAKMTPSAIR